MAANPRGLVARVRTPVATICFLFHAARMARPSGGYIAAIVCVDRLRSSEFGRGAPVSGLFGGGSVYFAFEQLSACPPECEVGVVCADRFEMVTNHVVIICEAFDFQLRNCGRIG